MRKGRSSRRSRVSRPLIGAKTPASSDDALSTEVGTSEPPRVVVVVPSSEPPPPVAADEGVREAKSGSSSTKSSSRLDPLEALEGLERKSTPPQAAPSAEEEEGEKAQAGSAAAVSGTAEDEAEAHTRSEGDFTAERFFSDGDGARHSAADALTDDALTVVDKMKRKAEPHVVERRARFARYVKWAVAGGALVCLAAFGRTLGSQASPPAAPSTVVAPPSEARTAAAKAAEPAAAPIATGKPIESAAASAEAKAGEPVAAASAEAKAAEPVAAASAEAKPTEEPAADTKPAAEAKPAEVTGDAKEEKAKARSLLERGKLAEAIAAGEKSVALDASDGEAWLILGAAYQEKGNVAEARRAYASCLKEAKTGPRHECGNMLR